MRRLETPPNLFIYMYIELLQKQITKPIEIYIHTRTCVRVCVVHECIFIFIYTYLHINKSGGGHSNLWGNHSQVLFQRGITL